MKNKLPALSFIAPAAATTIARPQHQMKFSFRQKLFTGFTILIILIVTVSLYSFYYSHKLTAAANWVNHTNNVLNEGEQTRALVSDIESGVQGYLISGDARYFEYLAIAKNTVSGHIWKMRELTKDNPRQQLRIDSLSELIANRIRFAEYCLEQKNKSGSALAVQLMADQMPSFHTYTIRNIISEIQREETGLLILRQKETDDSTMLFHEAFYAVISIAFVLLVVILFSINNNISVRKKSEVKLVQINNELLFQMQEKQKRATELIVANQALAYQIVEKEKAEVKIKESEVHYRSLVEQATDAICIADASKKFIDMNPYGYGVLGYQKKEALTLSLPDIIFAEDLVANPLRFGEVALGQIIRNERRLKKKDGTAIVMEVSTRLMEDGKFIMFGHDITERKRAEIHLGYLNENLQRQARELSVSNAELEQFAYVASHDLQEPLRTVTSFLTLLEKKYSDVIDDSGKKYIAFALDGARRMRHIILDLLEFSRVGKADGRTEKIDLNGVIREIQILFTKNIEEKKAVITVDALPLINGHRAPMRQVFQNLVGNALKYARSGIPVQINIAVKKTGDQWQFSVADNGIGIEQAYFEKIFVIFQRLHNKDEFSGTGIGLAITRKIIENQGGKIWVESEEGKGSTFYFTINTS